MWYTSIFGCVRMASDVCGCAIVHLFGRAELRWRALRHHTARGTKETASDVYGCVRMCICWTAAGSWQVVTEMCFVVRQAAGEWELDHRCAQAKRDELD